MKNSDWEDLLRRGKEDLKRSKEIFEKFSDYELSAYLAQQALEKHVKAYLLNVGAIQEPEKLRHIQFLGIISLIKDSINKLAKKHRNEKSLFLIFQQSETVVGHTSQIFRDIQRDPELKKKFFKHSLNMPLSSIEKNQIEKYASPVEKNAGRIATSTKKYDENKLTIENLQKIEKKTGVSPDIIKNFTKEFQEVGKTFSKIKNLDYSKINTTIEGWLEILKLFEKSKDYSSNFSVDALRGFFEIYLKHEIILKSFPHEEFGRYPDTIDGLKTSEIYSQRKEDLWNLIKEIEYSCLDLQKKIN